MNDFSFVVEEFNRLTNQYNLEVSKELRDKKYTHWIDRTKELLSKINERQRKYIVSLDLIRLESVVGAELFIDKDKTIIFYGCNGVGLYSVGLIKKGISRLCNSDRVTVSGVYNKTKAAGRPGIEYSYMTPMFLKSHLKGDRKFIDELFTLN